MQVKKTNYGIEITIPETGHNSEFKYQIRQVRTLNSDDRREQKLFAELEKGEKRATRRLLILIASMENFFKTLPVNYDEWREWNGKKWTGRNGLISPFDIWEYKNAMDFNTYYHDGIRDLIDEIDGYSIEYTEKSRHGWCF